MYDVAIIGLGPAGATLARLLSQKYKVVAINYDAGKGKCCGGLLSPDAQKALARFDITIPKKVVVDPQIFSVRTLDFDNKIESYYQRFYVNMNRREFDKYLISLIPSNVKIVEGLCNNIARAKVHYELNIKRRDEVERIKAKIIVGADGANSIVRNTFYRKNKIKKYIAIQEWYEDANNVPIYSCIFDKDITDSYCWTLSKDNSFIIGGAFPQEEGNSRFNLLKEKCVTNGMKLGKRIIREGCYVHMTSNLFNLITGKDNAYLIGEAAGFISPSSLEGISYAMDSAYALAECINKDMKNITGNYYLKTTKLRIKVLVKILKKPFMYNKFLRKIVMLSKFRAIRK